MIKKFTNLVTHARLSARLRLRLKQHDAPLGDLKFAVTDTAMTPWDILIEHRGGCLTMHWRAEALEDRHLRRSIAARGLPYLYYAARAREGADHLICDVSDGDRPSLADVGFSSPFASRGLLPDLYFFETGGYTTQRAQHAAEAVNWADRSDDIVWRGGMNGNGLQVVDGDLIGNGGVNQRLRMALACQGLDVDFKFVAGNDATEMLKKYGMLGGRVAAQTWLGRKYAIDIDGHSNAWDNFYHRMLFGCCVLKVASQAGYRQWYYHKLEPFVHFVPIKADLSDLAEQIDWVRSHPDAAQAIAAAGCQLAHSMTFETETEFAVQEIKRICTKKRNAIAATGSSSQAARDLLAPT